MSDTKEKILQTSLYLFALDGYEAVSVKRIADELDISKGALYKHFKNKRDIFNSIVQRMNELEAKQDYKICVPEKALTETMEAFRKRAFELLRKNTYAMYHFWTEDNFARDFRRMLLLEQFRNPEMNDLYQNYLVTGPMVQLQNFFASLQKPQPDMLAYKFYSQIFFLISMIDSTDNVINTETILQEHIDDFAERYFFIKKIDGLHKGLLQRAKEMTL